MFNMLRRTAIGRTIGALCLLLFVGVLTGCTPGEDNYGKYLEGLPVVVTGKAPWGSVNLRLASADVVVGRTPWGSNEITNTGNRYAGKTPWGGSDVTLVDGHLTGKLPWGGLDVKVTATTLDGKAPWGSVHLVLNGQNITGTTPWGSVSLTLGDGYHSFTDPAVVSALVAIIADEGQSS